MTPIMLLTAAVVDVMVFVRACISIHWFLAVMMTRLMLMRMMVL